MTTMKTWVALYHRDGRSTPEGPRYLPILEGKYRLVETGVCQERMDRDEGVYVYLAVPAPDLQLSNPTDLLHWAAWQEARESHVARGRLVSLPAPRPTSTPLSVAAINLAEPTQLMAELERRYEDSTVEIEHFVPGRGKVKARIIRPRVPGPLACPWCRGQCSVMWLGIPALLCGACAGTGVKPPSPPEEPPPIQSAA